MTSTLATSMASVNHPYGCWISSPSIEYSDKTWYGQFLPCAAPPPRYLPFLPPVVKSTKCSSYWYSPNSLPPISFGLTMHRTRPLGRRELARDCGAGRRQRKGPTDFHSNALRYQWPHQIIIRSNQMSLLSRS